MPAKKLILLMLLRHYNLSVLISLFFFTWVGFTDQGQISRDAQANTSSILVQASPQGDVPYLPTPQVVVEEMLKIAKVTSADIVYDLGSGDGRIPITAAQKYGARSVGIELNPSLVQEARENARLTGVSDKVSFREQNLFETDFSEATVVTLYLFSDVNLRLRPKLLRELKPGTRVVSHAFNMGKWQPEKVVKVEGNTIYYWVIPEKIPDSLLNSVE